MKHMFNKSRWCAVAGLAVAAISGLVSACNSHPVEFAQATGAISVHQERTPGTAAAVDILWVIDNSGSMCEEQEALRTNFRQFISQITDRNIDFHLGVTTTQMDTYSQDPVAVPGRLQSTPQPLPSAIATCHGDEGDPNNQADGYVPVRNAIELAIECAKDPSQWQHLLDVTDHEILCNLRPNPDREGCSCQVGGPEIPDEDRCIRDNLFPTYEGNVSPYREIDKVLRFSDYQDDESGQLDDEQLEKDFACMSFVGTSGYSIEKGLAAAVKAVSPEMTGGTVENPTDEQAPNYGFLRDSAKFSVIFVTDEMDCSHDGTLDEGTSCSGNMCAFANNPALGENSPLLSTEGLAEDLKTNLTKSKGYEFEDDSIVAASIHGRWMRYGETYPEGQPPTPETWDADCTQEPSEGFKEQTACDTSFGTAYSGDRYERFLRNFTNVFPEIPADPNAHMDGLICQPNRIADTLSGIGELIAGTASSCIYQVPYACTSSEQCPAYAFGEGTAECLPFAESGKSYCNSGLQLRLYPGEGDNAKTFEDLQSHEYCVEGSIGSTMVPDGCVIKPEMYEVEPCAHAETEAINIKWSDSRYFNTLSGYRVELVYTLLTEEQEASANNGGNDAAGEADAN